MNKRKVDDMIPFAFDSLKEANIVNKKGEINKNYRGQISSFGAAIAMGSLAAAVAFFSDKGSAEVHREYLIKAIESVISKSNGEEIDNLYKYVVDNKASSKCREEILNASMAIKLAMNLYKLVEGEK